MAVKKTGCAAIRENIYQGYQDAIRNVVNGSHRTPHLQLSECDRDGGWAAHITAEISVLSTEYFYGITHHAIRILVHEEFCYCI